MEESAKKTFLRLTMMRLAYGEVSEDETAAKILDFFNTNNITGFEKATLVYSLFGNLGEADKRFMPIKYGLSLKLEALDCPELYYARYNACFQMAGFNGDLTECSNIVQLIATKYPEVVTTYNYKLFKLNHLLRLGYEENLIEITSLSAELGF